MALDARVAPVQVPEIAMIWDRLWKMMVETQDGWNEMRLNHENS